MATPSAIHTFLTDAKVAKLKNPNPDKDFFARDTALPGFGLRVSPNNAKSYFVEATVGGRFIRKVVGKHAIQTVVEARKRALEALQSIRQGNGPHGTLDAPNPRLCDLSDVFLLDKRKVLRASTITDYSRVLNGEYFADWGDRRVGSIIGRDVLDRYQAICGKNGIGMANKAMRILSSLLNHGKATFPSLENWNNPVGALGRTRARKALRPRTGHIPLDALPRWLEALDAYVGGAKSAEERTRRKDVQLVLNLLLLTGLRSTEGRSLRWSDIDLKAQTLTVRGDIAKNHREVTLPLCTWLVDRLSERCRFGTDFVFPSPSGGFIRNLRRPLQAVTTISGLPITPHDLRRTFATFLDGVGAPFGVIKQLLNHASSSDVTERYIQRRGLDELRIYSELVFALTPMYFNTSTLRAAPQNNTWSPTHADSE